MCLRDIDRLHTGNDIEKGVSDLEMRLQQFSTGLTKQGVANVSNVPIDFTKLKTVTSYVNNLILHFY